MQNSRQWHFYDRVFRRWVVLQVSTLDELRKEMESCGWHDMDLLVPSNGMCLELDENTNSTNQRCTFIWLNGWSTATLIHEISHLVMYQFNQLDIPISLENTETFAHYTEFWYTQITRAYKKYPQGREPRYAKD